MVTGRTAALVWLTLVAWVGSIAPASGQDSAASEALFKAGVADMEAGKLETACPAIAESHRLEPRPGTLFTLAQCEAKWGKVASAVAHFSEYLGFVSQMPAVDHARHVDRAKKAQLQLEKLGPEVPHLTLVPPPGAPRELSVKRDGIVLSAASMGVALPVDPGEHVVVTRTPGGPEHTQHFRIGLREHKRVELVVKQSGAAPRGPARSSASGYRSSALVAGGIGVAGVVVGAVAGIVSIGKKKTVDDNCSGRFCNDEGLSAADDGRTAARVSTAGFAVGAAGLATAVVLWVLAPRSREGSSAARRWIPTASLGPGSSPLVGAQHSW
jgi:hypothetical protein